MGKAINIKGTEDTPKVILDIKKEEFEISGRSLPEDAEKFYAPIQKWMEIYVKNPCLNTAFTINLEYFNSSSVKQILRILIKLEQIVKDGKKVKITWFHHEDDELMEVRGQEIKSVLDVPFEIKAI